MSVIWNHTVEEVLGDAARRERRAHARSANGDATRDLAVTGVFIAIGHIAQHQLSSPGSSHMHERLPPRHRRPRGRCHRHQHSRACSPPATSPITSTARPSPRPAPGCMAALDADRYLEALDTHTGPLDALPATCSGSGSRSQQHPATRAPRAGMPWARRQSRSCGTNSSPPWSTAAASARAAAGSRATSPCSDAQRALRRRAAFIKTHSFGEFVFDFAWARAYERVGRRYYPKLTVRRAVHAGDRPAAADAAGPRRRRGAPNGCCRSSSACARPRASRACMRCSSMSPRARRARSAAGCCGATASSTGATAAIGDFEDYLASFTAEKRKKARRERRRVAEAGHRASRPASAPSSMSALLDRIYELHRDTFLRHGHEPYLIARLLQPRSRARCGRRCMVKLAVHGRDRWPRRSSSRCRGCALRALLGRGGGLPQPALRDLLSPGHRVLHRARHWGASSPARRASTRSRAVSSPPSPGRRTTSPIGRFRAAIARLPRARGRRGRCLRHRGAGRTCPTAGAATRGRSRETITWLSPARSARAVSAARAGAARIRAGLLAAGGDLSPGAAAGRLPRAASFPGIRPVSRCCGGHPTRARCCSRRSFTSRAAWRRRCAAAASWPRSIEDFAGVIDGCAAPRARKSGHLDHAEMRAAYLRAAPARACAQHRDLADGMLVGGLYGVRLGGVFFGESMFSRERDASKAALAHLVALCAAQCPGGHRLPAALAPPGEPRRAHHSAQRSSRRCCRACPRRRTLQPD